MSRSRWSKKSGEKTWKKKKPTNRTCKRCGLKQNVDDMHYSKQFCGFLCNDRQQCSGRLTEDYKNNIKKSGRLA